MFRLFLSNLGHDRSIFGRPERPKCVAPTMHTFEKIGPKWPFFGPIDPKAPFRPKTLSDQNVKKNVLIGLQTSQTAFHGTLENRKFLNFFSSRNLILG